MTERDTLQYLRTYGKRVEENEAKIVKLEESIKLDPRLGLVLKGPIYYSNNILPIDTHKTNIGGVNNFVNNIYLSGKIIYPDALDFGVNNDFCIDKMGKIGFHTRDNLDGLTIKGLPFFSIQNVIYIGNDVCLFEINDGNIMDFINNQDVLFIDNIAYQVLNISRDRIKIKSLHNHNNHKTHMEIDKKYNLIIYNNLFGICTSKNEQILKINGLGDIFYKTVDRNAEININGSAYFDKDVFINELKAKSIILENDAQLIPNMNAEFLCGKKAPLNGDLVSTKDKQELFNKSFGDEVIMHNNRILDLGDPLYDMDAANKRYVDRYLSGIKISKPVTCVSVETIDAEYDRSTGNLHLRVNDNLKSNTMIHNFDDYKLQINERVLIMKQINKWQNGVYVVTSDGLENGRIILQRTWDFCEKKSPEELKSFYTFVRNGKIFGNTGFVFEYNEDFIWNESPIRFNIFSRMENYGAINGIKKIGNNFSLHLEEDVFKIEENKIGLKEGKIGNKYLENKGIIIIPEGGIDLDKSLIQLGDNIKLGLRVNKKQFQFGKNGELQLANIGSDKSDKSDNNDTLTNISAINSFMNVFQLMSPKRFEIVMQYSDDFFEKERDIDIQYYICSINSDGKETNHKSSDVYNICDDAKSIFANLDWDITDGDGYVIYRRINNSYTKIRLTQMETSLLDIIVPRNFSKIDWKSCNAPPIENQTKFIVNRIGTNGDNFITSGKLGIGTVTPKSVLHIKMNEINKGDIGLYLDGNENTKEMIKMVGKGMKNVKITGENGEGSSTIEMGKNIKLVAGDDEGVIYFGRDDSPEDKNINNKIGSDDFVVQVPDGSIYSGGEIMAGDSKPFASYNNKLGNNAAILKTGCVSNSIGNQVAFSWEGDQLHAIPFNDGNILTRKKVQVKNFTIQHPVYPEKYLVHACLEGATADVYYRGKAEILTAREFVDIKLPDYYYHIVEHNSSTIQLTPIGKPFCQLGGEIFEKENILRVYCNMRCNVRIPFYWEIKGKRFGTNFKVEPDKDEVEVKKWGPYTYMAE